MTTINNKTKSGKIRKKRDDTLIKSIEKKYNVDLGVRSDMQLGNYLKKEGLPSLSKLIQKKKGKKSGGN
ncbi:hypothetical protein KC660_04125 [Candidatus Dojkabacteria bacterium]|uniref:Uncharacterized protein n=1 Tax=Candidatus Dojkabacteria bacterium TaxID=2099670 RepID=A0A955L404_9BACT|nr:hypothetical protein [Candidatus Dojkabacteria bacterium]